MPAEVTREPITVWDEDTDRTICNLCGSADIQSGYGMAGGGGPGLYNYCNKCNRVLDKSPDPETA